MSLVVSVVVYWTIQLSSILVDFFRIWYFELSKASHDVLRGRVCVCELYVESHGEEEEHDPESKKDSTG